MAIYTLKVHLVASFNEGIYTHIWMKGIFEIITKAFMLDVIYSKRYKVTRTLLGDRPPAHWLISGLSLIQIDH